jgi:nuclear transport factor 2 (NTF2) superfamily protein
LWIARGQPLPVAGRAPREWRFDTTGSLHRGYFEKNWLRPSILLKAQKSAGQVIPIRVAARLFQYVQPTTDFSRLSIAIVIDLFY